LAKPDATDQVFRFRHLAELDGFRGLAVLFVVIGRYWEFRAPTAELRSLTQHLAQLGVLLFFVLSGFLITGLLYRERALTGSISFKRFYIRRALRLLPPIFLFLSTVVILMRFRLVTDVTNTELLECLLYLRNIFGHSLTLGHFWSLALEEQFYLLWPITFLLLPLNRAAKIVAWVCAAFMLWRGVAIAISLFPYEHGIYYVRPYFRFDSILIGALVVLIISSSQTAYGKLQRFVSVTSGTAFLLAAGVWYAVGEKVSRSLHITIAEILVAFLILHVAMDRKGLVSKLFRSKFLGYFGKISYSLYLWQELFTPIEGPSWGAARQLPWAFVIPIAISILSYHFMERPILQLKDRIAGEAHPRGVSTQIDSAAVGSIVTESDSAGAERLKPAATRSVNE
jgi:peptidoglycan/LPS O-acetylase OafA/YrhL